MWQASNSRWIAALLIASTWLKGHEQARGDREDGRDKEKW